MTDNHDLNRLCIMMNMIDLLCKERPHMRLHNANEVLRSISVVAMTEPFSDKLLTQAALEGFNSEAVQENLPPWQD